MEKKLNEIDVMVALLSGEQELTESVRCWMLEILVEQKKILGSVFNSIHE